MQQLIAACFQIQRGRALRGVCGARHHDDEKSSSTVAQDDDC